MRRIISQLVFLLISRWGLLFILCLLGLLAFIRLLSPFNGPS
jgi:hypothetical protein